ncbi:hypothetical protein D5125_17045 [Magnetovirga frankeli]|uniref:hypothetical protein n=1 Tax=Magnetovirga frankeli TaxID=947516 RepID=UPI0012936857|nr:hypothetical protein D5125_17045 [gamma proteobacterium SS-5]
MNRLWYALVLLLLVNMFFFYDAAIDSSYRILIVKIEDRDSEISEIPVILESLRKGGMININVEIARKIKPNFDELYAITDSEGMFRGGPALLNWVSDHGWKFTSTTMGDSVFTKKWSILSLDRLR